MKDKELNLLDWQKHYGTEEACAQALFSNVGRKDFAARTAGMIMVMA